MVAIKAVAHKLCRACYYIMRDRVPFRYEKSFQRKVSFYGWDGTASSYRGWLTTMRFDWPLSHP